MLRFCTICTISLINNAKKFPSKKVRTKALLAYGDIGLDGIIPPGQDQEYTIELLEIGESPKFSTMSEEELSDFVLMLKDRGNFYFSRKEYEKGIFVYRRASGIVDVPPESEDLRKLFSALHSNLAVCYSKLGDVDQVLHCTEESLRLHCGNPKALYHRSVALSSRSDFEQAAKCLQEALVYEPNDISIANELTRLTGLRRRRNQDERMLYKKMLPGASEPAARRQWWSSPTRLAGIVFFVVMSLAFLYFLSQM